MAVSEKAPPLGVLQWVSGMPLSLPTATGYFVSHNSGSKVRPAKSCDATQDFEAKGLGAFGGSRGESSGAVWRERVDAQDAFSAAAQAKAAALQVRPGPPFQTPCLASRSCSLKCHGSCTLRGTPCPSGTHVMHIAFDPMCVHCLASL